MLFASFDFLLFFIPVLAAAWALRERPRAWLWLLLAASYFFYSASARPPAGEVTPPWTFAGLLVVSTLLDFVAGREIHAARLRERQGGTEAHRGSGARGSARAWSATSACSRTSSTSTSCSRPRSTCSGP